MAIVDYDTLSAAIKVWAARSDSTFSGQIPTFVALAEDRLYNGAGKAGEAIYSAPLRSKIMEVTSAVTATNGVADVPTSFLEARSIAVDGQTVGLEYLPPERFAIWNEGETGSVPLYYTTQGAQILLTPASTVTLNLTYYRRYDAISDSNKTGPMIIEHGLIYLEAALYEAFAFIQEPELAMSHLARARGMIDGANLTSSKLRTTGPLRIRQRVPMP